MDFSVADEIAHISVERPHVVLLGAGASRAAFPDGERHGRKLPLMADFVEVVPVKHVLEHTQIEYDGRNFEHIYMELDSDVSKLAIKQQLEDTVFQYFSSLELPDEPTLYDHLLLSLRPKDVIATFNWDPFLIQAASRRNIPEMPKIAFLHGNVLEGFCERDQMHGRVERICSRCGELLRPTKLLYPIGQKNYEEDSAISSAWELVETAFRNAFMITVFGYSAPQSDLGAMRILRAAWGGTAKRDLEQFEVIDLRPEEALIESWKGFIDPGQHHYEIHGNFYESWVAKHPRRTGEAWAHQYIDALFIEDNPIPRDYDFEELWAWYAPLIEAERVPHGKSPRTSWD